MQTWRQIETSPSEKVLSDFEMLIIFIHFLNGCDLFLFLTIQYISFSEIQNKRFLATTEGQEVRPS